MYSKTEGLPDRLDPGWTSLRMPTKPELGQRQGHRLAVDKELQRGRRGQVAIATRRQRGVVIDPKSPQVAADDLVARLLGQPRQDFRVAERLEPAQPRPAVEDRLARFQRAVDDRASLGARVLATQQQRRGDPILPGKDTHRDRPVGPLGLEGPHQVTGTDQAGDRPGVRAVVGIVSPW